MLAEPLPLPAPTYPAVSHQYEHLRDPNAHTCPAFFYSQLRTNIDAPATTFVYVFAHDAHNPAAGVLGMAVIDVEEPAAWISSLFVEEPARGKGVGEGLLNQCFAIAREHQKASVGLSVHNDNARARKLYERLGFFQYLRGQGNTTQLVKQL